VTKLSKLLKRYKYEITSGLFGGFFFIYFWGEIINPTYIAWIVGDGMDTFQHYIGWEFYRNSDLSFPVGLITDVGYPVGVPVSFMDIVPLFALMFRPFSSLLPQPFQYQGIWMLFCFIMQGVVGYKLSKEVVKKKSLALISTLFLIASPIMIYRVAGHSALVAHWLILGAMYLVVKYRDQFPLGLWILVLVLSVLIHPYIFFMIGPIMVVHLFELWWKEEVSLSKISQYFLLQVIVVVGISYIVGLFYIGSSGTSGFGKYSMNLNSLFNPYWGNWSPIMPNFHTGRYQYEGFSYLGLGMISLLLFSFISSLWHLSVEKIKDFFANYWFYFVLSVLFVIFAIGPIVMYGNKVLLEIEVPTVLNNLLGTVRASGRFIWPVYYVLFLLAVLGLKKRGTVIAIILGVTFFSFQIYDLSPYLWGREQPKFEDKHWKVSLPDYWNELKEDYEHIVFIPTYPKNKELKKSSYSDLVFTAAMNDMTINTAYISRPIKGKNQHIVKQETRLKRGNYAKDSIYIILPKKKELVDKKDENDLVKEEREYILFVPDYYK